MSPARPQGSLCDFRDERVAGADEDALRTGCDGGDRLDQRHLPEERGATSF